MSMVWIGVSGNDCGGADLDEDGVVGLNDFQILCQYWLVSNCYTQPDPELCNRANLDGKTTESGLEVDLKDFAIFTQYWLMTDCK